MKQFVDFLLEAKEAVTAGSKADSTGKLFEIMTAGHMMAHTPNSGGQFKFPEHFRHGDVGPQQAHDTHARYVFGDDFKNHSGYKRLQAHAHGMANHIAAHMEKNVKGFKRGHITNVLWTSQAGDHEKATGVKDKLFNGDLIINHKAPGAKKVSQHGVSLKISNPDSGVKTKTNFANKGEKSLNALAGISHTAHITHKEAHKKRIAAAGIKASLEEAKKPKAPAKPRAMGNKPLWKEGHISDAQKTIAQNSHAQMLTGVAGELHKGFVAKYHSPNQHTQDSNIRGVVKTTIGANGNNLHASEEEREHTGQTHLPVLFAKRTLTMSGGTKESFVHNSTNMADNYLSHFHKMKFNHNGKTGINISGEHKGTGKTHTVLAINLRAPHRYNTLGTGWASTTIAPTMDHSSIDLKNGYKEPKPKK